MELVFGLEISRTRSYPDTKEEMCKNNKSTFSRFEDDDENFMDEIGEGDHYVMEQAKEPMDIIWSNMSGTRGLYFWRRLGLLVF